MDKIKILVACHKPWKVYQDDIYTPIHVGRTVSKYKDEMADMIGDDTGDNISEKNPQYCELTAQYWAWKNLHDVEYIGFCHYRRYFDIQLTNDNIDALFKKTDVVCLELVPKSNIYHDLLQSISIDDLTILIMVMKRLHPEYEQVVIDFFFGNILYDKNMFICRKEVFDSYAEWLFGILFECEKYIKPSPYSRGRRSLAYLGEYLLPVYLMYHQYHLKKVAYVDYIGQHKHSSLRENVIISIKKLHGLIDMYYQHKPKSWNWFIRENVLTGFKIDNICI